uniref:Uncharacterized protein n=1 Tax=Myoviridae sp. ctqfO1 TaxID=2827710 RepID=A0A8S5T2P9_9CAUD|nr:MAG TPA: hypothetical protein [Myoviridae sp. ctqfO1]
MRSWRSASNKGWRKVFMLFSIFFSKVLTANFYYVIL